MEIVDKLVDEIRQKRSVIGIFGLGYVGLPLILSYCRAGYQVVGFDVDVKKVRSLKDGKSYIKHISDSDVQSAISQGLEITNNMSAAIKVDALILCVPTPLNQYREPDLSYVINTVDSLIPFLRSGQVVSLESTTYPGTTEEELIPRVESAGLRVGEEIFVVYSPEREDPGNPKFSTRDIPKVCGGHTASCLEVGVALYEQVINCVVPVSSPRVAELTKLLENIHRAVNIGLVNEMKIVADEMDIDIYEVIRAAATKPFGFVPYYPGPGLGGHCIPIDPFYLTWKAREYGVHTRFIELAGEINSGMPDYVLDKVFLGLNSQKCSINGSRVLVLGVAYKKNVDDMRESPSIALMEKLRKLGAEVHFSDPHIPVFPIDLRGHSFDLRSVELKAENVASYDCVL
ncbi:MAG: nucleotide sugar dehydrogenase, partial [Burkholderiales bacterium]|nr:nucleotide sugar dehydrogenase [Burkholderiales bacterium]